MLAPVMDFEKHSVTEIYSETLPPGDAEGHQGQARAGGHESRAGRAGDGQARCTNRARRRTASSSRTGCTGRRPGKITFVTFKGDKVIKVKEAYAGLGSQVQDPQ